MKPLKLTLSAFGSYGGTENFRHAGIWQEPFSV